jgi:hypothetical protein
LIARFLAVAVLAGAPVSSRADEEKIAFEQLPPAVQSAARKHLGPSELKGAVKETDDQGAVAYEIETSENGKDKDIVLDSDGRLLEISRELDVSALPPPVLEGIRALASGGRILEAESTDRGGIVTYEAVVITPAGRLSKFRVDAEGRKLAPNP